MENVNQMFYNGYKCPICKDQLFVPVNKRVELNGTVYDNFVIECKCRAKYVEEKMRSSSNRDN